jgi:hypothetical protein
MTDIHVLRQQLLTRRVFFHRIKFLEPQTLKLLDRHYGMLSPINDFDE